MSSKGLVVISGASRGIGRAIALAIADSPIHSSHLHMVLMARSASSLQETADMIQERCENRATIITTTCHEMDLANIDTLPMNVQKILEPLQYDQYNSCLLINNAGSLGPLGQAVSICDDGSPSESLQRWKETIDFNITSSLWLSSQFAKATANVEIVRVVNISSLCAIDPFATMSLYCAGKAARDMFHAVLAKEHTPCDSLSTTSPAQFKLLNYAPGACETEMTDTLADSHDLDNDLNDFFRTSREKKDLIKPNDTAEKLVGLLVKDEFESGSHIDYWDV